MEKATISQLKNHLSAYLKMVRAGHSILILNRDQPVARLERVDGEGHPQDRLSRLERAGLLRRSTRSMPAKALRSAAAKSKRSVVRALLDERKRGR